MSTREECMMESPRTMQDSKELRWTERPSEEELLGSLERSVRPTPVSFEPTALLDWGVTEAPASEPAATTTGWRLQPRDLVALAAVAAAVWLAIRGSESLPFHSASPTAPASASEVFRTTLSPDRRDTAAPRSTSPADKTPGTKQGGGGGGGSHDHQDGGSRGSGGGHETPPPADGNAEPPLVEATIPGVRTVKVDQPEAPDTSGLGLPDLPDTGDVLPKTPTVTVSLP
jgi:hypothetical protein